MRSTLPRSHRPVGSAAFTLVAALALAAAATASSAEVSAKDVIRKMKEALEPSRPSLRALRMTVRQDGQKAEFRLLQARKADEHGQRALTVVVAPPGARGLAYLVEEPRGDQPATEHVYVPIVRRTRTFVPAENHTAFLGSDLTFGDLGFVSVDSQDRLVGEGRRHGRPAFEIESVPSSSVQQWYYSKVVTWIDRETMLPIERAFYSPAGQVFKTETFAQVAHVDGISTPLAIRIEKAGSDSSTELEVTSISYGIEIPDDLFAPDRLASAAERLEKLAEKTR